MAKARSHPTVTSVYCVDAKRFFRRYLWHQERVELRRQLGWEEEPMLLRHQCGGGTKRTQREGTLI